MKTFLVTLLLLPVLARAEEQTASVLYVTGTTYYVGAGRAQGVDVGDVFEVRRDGVVVARLTVQHVSSQRAACDLAEGEAVEVGDEVVYQASTVAAPVPMADEGDEAGPATSAPARSLRDYGIRGRVGVRQYSVIDRTGVGEDLVRPSLDLRVEGRRIGGIPVDAHADVRAQRSFGRDDDGRARVYRLWARWQPASWSLTLGRQTSSALPNTGIFDGLTAEFGKNAFAVGALSGTQPDVDHGFGRDVWEHGLYARARGEAWSTVLGAVGSYLLGEIDREYVYVGGHFHRGSVSGSLRQEVDIHRDWRADVESSTFSPTSTYARLHGRVGTTSLGVGFDNRRAVRLFRTRETPETAFDDRYRQGVWARASFRTGPARVSVEGRTRRGAASGDADSGTLAVRRVPIASLPLRADARATLYRNDLVRGALASLGVDARVNHHFTARAFGGSRFEEDRGNAFTEGSAWWVGLDAELTVGAAWLLAASFEHVAGGDDARETVYSGISYRF